LIAAASWRGGAKGPHAHLPIPGTAGHLSLDEEVEVDPCHELAVVLELEGRAEPLLLLHAPANIPQGH
jgi:hypothetical protein